MFKLQASRNRVRKTLAVKRKPIGEVIIISTHNTEEEDVSKKTAFQNIVNLPKENSEEEYSESSCSEIEEEQARKQAENHREEVFFNLIETLKRQDDEMIRMINGSSSIDRSEFLSPEAKKILSGRNDILRNIRDWTSKSISILDGMRQYHAICEKDFDYLMKGDILAGEPLVAFYPNVIPYKYREQFLTPK